MLLSSEEFRGLQPNIGLVVNTMRRSAGMKKKELARIVGMDESALIEVEEAGGSLTYAEFHAICTTLGVSMQIALEELRNAAGIS